MGLVFAGLIIVVSLVTAFFFPVVGGRGLCHRDLCAVRHHGGFKLVRPS